MTAPATMSAKGLELLKHFEAFRPCLYNCPAGLPTIGYGHVVKPNERRLRDATLSEAEATELMRHDLECFEAILHATLGRHVVLKQHEADALLSFIFNIGGRKWEASSVLPLFREGSRDLAIKTWARYCYAGQRRLRGLERRRQAEIKLFCTGTVEVAK